MYWVPARANLRHQSSVSAWFGNQRNYLAFDRSACAPSQSRVGTIFVSLYRQSWIRSSRVEWRSWC